ncbi:MAG: hypothetical protein JJU41_10095 [Bacteroidetes bacterium]|nr:hypothetical protein [Bacteroidota bacterium]MCH8523487.1 hypothetical protein [Balneolales bacterium]
MNITDKAVETLRNIIPADDLETGTVRFFMAEGCCGPSLQMGITGEVPETDETFEVDGVRFSVASEAREQVAQVTLNADESGFRLEGYTAPACQN